MPVGKGMSGPEPVVSQAASAGEAHADHEPPAAAAAMSQVRTASGPAGTAGQTVAGTASGTQMSWTGAGDVAADVALAASDPAAPPSGGVKGPHEGAAEAPRRPIPGPSSAPDIAASPEAPAGSPAAQRRQRREAQIAFGKATMEYARYLAAVPKALRESCNAAHPVTPRPDTDTSKRSWDRELQRWRVQRQRWAAAEEIEERARARCAAAPAGVVAWTEAPVHVPEAVCQNGPVVSRTAEAAGGASRGEGPAESADMAIAEGTLRSAGVPCGTAADAQRPLQGTVCGAEGGGGSSEPHHDPLATARARAAAGPEEVDADIHRRLTVVVTTSAAPSNPSTELIEFTLASFARVPGLCVCRVLVVCDAPQVAARTEYKLGRVTPARAASYAEYVQRLQDACARRAGAFAGLHAAAVLRLGSRHGFAYALRAALAHVTTPYVMPVQHDRSFILGFALRRVLDVMDARPDVQYVMPPEERVDGAAGGWWVSMAADLSSPALCNLGSGCWGQH